MINTLGGAGNQEMRGKHTERERGNTLKGEWEYTRKEGNSLRGEGKYTQGASWWPPTVAAAGRALQILPVARNRVLEPVLLLRSFEKQS